MKKLAKIVAIAAACAALTGSVAAFSACGDSYDLYVSGSSSVTPLMRVLAAKYEEETGIRIQIQQSDSTSGVNDAIDGLNDFGMASRDLNDDEVGEASQTTIAIDGVALITNKNNTTVTDVSSEELYNLYANGTAIQGTITAGISREDGSGTRDAFDDLIKNAAGDKLKDLKTLDDCISEANSTGVVMTSIAANNAGNQVGYISMGSVGEAEEQGCKTLLFGGVEPTAENVSSGAYALQRNFNIVYNTETGLSETAKAFIDWILTAEAQAIVVEEGYISINK